MKRFFFTFFCCFFILGIVSSAFRNRNLSLRSEDPWEPFIEQVSAVRDYLGPNYDTIRLDTTLFTRQGQLRIRVTLVISGQPLEEITVFAKSERPDSTQVLSYSLSHSRHGWELDGNSAEATDLYFLEIVQRLLENAVHEKRERMKYNQFNIVTASAQMRIFVT